MHIRLGPQLFTKEILAILLVTSADPDQIVQMLIIYTVCHIHLSGQHEKMYPLTYVHPA